MENDILSLLPLQIWNTIYMVLASSFFALLIGLPLGVVLTMSDKGGIKESLLLYKILGAIVNIGRSFPFAILMVALIPFTRLIVGTSLGTTASIVPLTIAAAPMFARIIETSLKEVDRNIVEAAIVMGSKIFKIISMMLHESLPNIISGITLAVINLIGYSAMAGLVGGGGLGQVAIQYGYYRFNTFIMIVTVVLLILLVQIVQWIGTSLSKRVLKKRGKLEAE